MSLCDDLNQIVLSNTTPYNLKSCILQYKFNLIKV